MMSFIFYGNAEAGDEAKPQGVRLAGVIPLKNGCRVSAVAGRNPAVVYTEKNFAL